MFTTNCVHCGDPYPYNPTAVGVPMECTKYPGRFFVPPDSQDFVSAFQRPRATPRAKARSAALHTTAPAPESTPATVPISETAPQGVAQTTAPRAEPTPTSETRGRWRRFCLRLRENWMKLTVEQVADAAGSTVAKWVVGAIGAGLLTLAATLKIAAWFRTG